MSVAEIARKIGSRASTIYRVLHRLDIHFKRIHRRLHIPLPPRRKSPQTLALEAEVRAYRAQGLTVAEIVRKTGRHVRTIQRIHRRLHLPLPPRRKSPQTLALEAQVRAYREQGMSGSEIARKIGRNSKTVYKIFYRLNIPLRKRSSRPG